MGAMSGVYASGAVDVGGVGVGVGVEVERLGLAGLAVSVAGCTATHPARATTRESATMGRPGGPPADATRQPTRTTDARKGTTLVPRTSLPICHALRWC